MTFVTFTQVDSGIVTADVRKIVSPVRVHETQDSNVASHAACHIRDIQDWLCTFNSGSVHWLFSLGLPPADQGKYTSM